MSWWKSNSSLLTILFILVVISIPAILPLLHHGFFITDDGEWMVIRFSAFYQALADGQFPVRFLQRLNFDYGYPVVTFLYPGFMYLGVPFHLLKIGLVDTIKIIFGVSLISTTIFTYLWLARLFSKRAALVGAFASLYLPYHLFDVYTRGSVGEIFALVFVPFILWMLERKNFFFVSLGIGFLLIAHNSLALLFLPLLFLYAFLRRSFSIEKTIICFILGSSLSAFFTVPAIVELQLTNFSKTVIADPTKYFADLSLIGFSTFLIFIVAGGLFIFQKKSDKEHDSLIRLFLLITFFAVGLSSQWSGFFWQNIPSSFIQFPFRLLSYLVVSIAFLAAFIIANLPQIKMHKFAVAAIVLVTLLSAYFFMLPKEYINRGEGYYLTNQGTTTVHDEYLPTWVKERPLVRPMQKAEIVSGAGTIGKINYDNTSITFSSELTKESIVRVNTLYWPGWTAWINNKQTGIDYNNPKGLMDFTLPPGEYDIHLQFQETPLRLVSDGISVTSLVLLILYSIRLKRTKKK